MFFRKAIIMTVRLSIDLGCCIVQHIKIASIFVRAEVRLLNIPILKNDNTSI